MAELTPRVARKLAQLLQAGEDAGAAVQVMQPKRQRLEEERAAAQRAARAAPEDEALQRIAEDLERRFAGLVAELDRRRERHQHTKVIFHHCNDFAKGLPYRATVVDVEPLPPATPERADLDVVRERIAFFKNGMARIKELPPHGSEMRAFIERYVAEMAERHTPRLDMRGKFVLDWNRVDVLGTPIGVMGVLCWAQPEVMVERLMAEMAAQIGLSDTVIGAEQRQQLTADAEKILPLLELHEESIIEALLESGVDVARRLDASPAAVLQVSVANVAVAA